MNMLFITTFSLLLSASCTVFSSESCTNIRRKEKEIMIQEAQKTYNKFVSDLLKNEQLSQQQYEESLKKLQEALKFSQKEKVTSTSNKDAKHISSKHHKKSLATNYDLLWYELYDLCKEGQYSKKIEKIPNTQLRSFLELQKEINNN